MLLAPAPLPVRRAGRRTGCSALALSFVDGSLVTFATSIFVAGMAASFLLGNLRDARARADRPRRSRSAARRSSSTTSPTHSTGELIFIPLLFGIGWLAGFALEARAPSRPRRPRCARPQAEREREAAARIAVAEERARIARELHDIVAHAVSVMVLQVGAVRHKLPDELAEEEDALRGVEQTGRSALAEMRRLLGAMRSDGRRSPSSRRSRASSGSTRSPTEVGRAGLPVERARRGRAGAAAAGDRPLRLPDRAGGADERAQARARRATPT